MENHKQYKQYLEPGSQEPIPSSSRYRYRTMFNEEVKEGSSQLFQPDTENDSKMDCPQPTTLDNVMEEEITEAEVDSERIRFNRQNDLMKEEQCDELLPTEADEVVYEEDESVVEEVLHSLADELDAIENENVVEYYKIDDEDDYFVDVVDDDEFWINEDVDATHENADEPFQQCFNSFERMKNSENLKQPITVPVTKSAGEILLMILKYALVHALSLTEITDLFMLINCIFAFHILPNTRYLIDKLFYPRSSTELYATCTNCGAYIGRFTLKERSLNCTVCNSNINVKDYAYQDFFVTLDIASPISKLIESNSEYYKYLINERIHEKNIIRDIYDGKRYREFVNSLSEADKYRYATVTFNTDGAPLFESSRYSIWPIYLMVNELPYHIRTKELILVGLWFGKNKPNMNVFLGPFVEKMHTLSTKGVQCILNRVEICIKIFALICCVDSVARASVQGFVQFNGRYGCHQCLHPGESVKSDPHNKRSGTMKYPLRNTVSNERNVKEIIKAIGFNKFIIF